MVLRNTKPDALAPRREPQAIRIDFEPAMPPPDGVYERISFSSDDIVESERETGAPKRETQPERLVRLLREHGPQTTTSLCVMGGFLLKGLREIARKARDKGFHVSYHASSEKWVLTLPTEPSSSGDVSSPAPRPLA